MLCLKNKKRYLFSTIALCFSSLLSQSNIALAQLRLGRGIQPGLERHLLEYQSQQQPLEKMRGLSGCSIGIGVGCNKTASLLQKIVTESSGKTYQDILLQAAGGQSNYSRFARHYPQNVDLSFIPLNSFWINGGDYILDSHQYSGIGDLERIPESGFRQIVSQFRYSPVTQGRNNLNLQQGLIGLKTAYGKTLLEEARKIPNIEQKIAASGLDTAETNFHLQQFLNSVEAIETGNQQQLNHSLYRLLSNPYTSEPSNLNRPSLGISSSLDRQIGVGLEGDEYISSLVAGEASETVIFNSSEVTIYADSSNGGSSGNNTPLYVAAGVGSVTLLVLLLTNLDESSGSNAFAASTIVPSNSHNSADVENPVDSGNVGDTDNPSNSDRQDNPDNPDNTNNPNSSDDSNNTNNSRGRDNVGEMEDSGNNPFPTDEENPEIVVVNPPVVVEKDPVLDPPTDEVVAIPESTSAMQFVILVVLALLILKKRTRKPEKVYRYSSRTKN